MEVVWPLDSFIQEIETYKDNGLLITDAIARLGLAAVLGMLIGLERARREQSAGMRTYAVVSMASSLIMLVSIYGLPMVEGRPQDPGRIAAQVVSGIGFLGAGIIFMRQNVVHGLTTAASLWAVSGVGLAVGGGLMITGTIATGFLLLISGGLYPVKRRLFNQNSSEHRVRLHLTDATAVIPQIRALAIAEPGFELTSLDFESTVDKRKSVMELRIKVKDPDDAILIVKNMEAIAGVDRIGWHVGEMNH